MNTLENQNAIFPKGEKASADYFTGTAWVNILVPQDETGSYAIGIYNVPLKPVLKPYRKAAEVIEASDLEYTILRPTWFTNVDEVDYEITQKGEPEKGSVISQKSLATLITKIIECPEKYIRANLGVNKPGS